MNRIHRLWRQRVKVSTCVKRLNTPVENVHWLIEHAGLVGQGPWPTYRWGDVADAAVAAWNRVFVHASDQIWGIQRIGEEHCLDDSVTSRPNPESVTQGNSHGPR